jgi:predicted  nucleic acid-binding Zn-ribbon protein
MNTEKDKLTTFSLSVYGDVTSYNEVLSKARCRIFYKGANRNGTFITDEFAEQLISTLPYVPVKGIYDTMKDDFTDHGRERYEGRIYGIVPENPNFAWETHLDVDGVERTYACTDVYLFTGLYKQEAFDIVEKSQSMELYADSIDGEWQFINGKRYFVFTKGRFLGLQALGEDYEPCFEGAAFYTFVDSVKTLMTDLNGTDIFQKQNLEGEKHMNFKLSDNQKYNMLWTLLNNRFNEENEYAMDYAICEVYDEYAVVFKFETGEYNRAYYTKNDETDSLSIDKMEVCYIVDVNEAEKQALQTVHAMNNNTYEKIDEVVADLNTKVEDFTTQIDEFNSKIEENDTTIATLQQDNEKLENELSEAKDNYTTALEKIDTLTSENEALNNFKAAVELQDKEAVIAKYSTLLDEEELNGFKERVDEFTKEELDKELAFALVQSKSTIFTNDDNGFIPKPEEHLTGIEAILTRQKNKKK